MIPRRARQHPARSCGSAAAGGGRAKRVTRARKVGQRARCGDRTLCAAGRRLTESLRLRETRKLPAMKSTTPGSTYLMLSRRSVENPKAWCSATRASSIRINPTRALQGGPHRHSRRRSSSHRHNANAMFTRHKRRGQNARWAFDVVRAPRVDASPSQHFLCRQQSRHHLQVSSLLGISSSQRGATYEDRLYFCEKGKEAEGLVVGTSKVLPFL